MYTCSERAEQNKIFKMLKLKTHVKCFYAWTNKGVQSCAASFPFSADRSKIHPHCPLLVSYVYNTYLASVFLKEKS